MVKHGSALCAKGVTDWRLLRFSAVIIFLYALYLGVFLFSASPVTFDTWTQFFSSWPTQWATFLVLLAVLLHGWIGLWQVLTDYVKAPRLRGAFQLIIGIVLLLYLFFGAKIVWGISL